MKKLLISLPILAIACSFASAQSQLLVQTDRLGYTGTAESFATLSDAENNINGTPVANFAQRDLSTFVDTLAGDPYNPSVMFLTAWYYTTDPDHGEYSGWGNPNNTDDSFLQIADTAGLNGGAPQFTSVTGGWQDNYTEFTLNAQGAYNYEPYSRLGVDGNTTTTGGAFISYTADMTFTGLNGTPDGSNPGFYTYMGDPTGISGSISGIFQGDDSATNNFYRFDLDLNMTSWVYNIYQTDPGSLNGPYPYSPPEFSAQAVPEPTSLYFIAGLGLALIVRRKK